MTTRLIKEFQDTVRKITLYSDKPKADLKDLLDCIKLFDKDLILVRKKMKCQLKK